MSGAKRRSQYRKNVTTEFLSGDIEPKDGELIAKIVGNRGGSIFDVELENGASSAAFMPNRFKNMIWVKRNDFVIVVGTQSEDDKAVDFEISHILSGDNIKYLVSIEKWPSLFETKFNKKKKDISELMAEYNRDDHDEEGQDESL